MVHSGPELWRVLRADLSLVLPQEPQRSIHYRRYPLHFATCRRRLSSDLPPVARKATDLLQRVSCSPGNVRTDRRPSADPRDYLPNGQVFTVEQFQLIGINLGRSEGGRALYYLIEDAFVTTNGQETLSYSFLNTMLEQQSYLTNPIYAILHESIYCQQQASDWAAHRVRSDFPQCNYKSDGDFWFTGEMVYPWMFDQLETLKPLKDAAEILAAKQDWSALYDEVTLAQNQVPVAAAVYVEDMYVEFDFSRETLSSMPNAKAWMTNEYEHNGLGADGEKILDRLITMTETIRDVQTLNKLT